MIEAASFPILIPGLVTPSAEDDDVPPAGGVFIYLVTAVGPGGEGPAGYASDGSARVLVRTCQDAARLPAG